MWKTLIILAGIGGIYLQNYFYYREILKRMADEKTRLDKIVIGVTAMKKALDDAQEQIQQLKTNNPEFEQDLTTLENLIGGGQDAFAEHVEAHLGDAAGTQTNAADTSAAADTANATGADQTTATGSGDAAATAPLNESGSTGSTDAESES